MTPPKLTYTQAVEEVERILEKFNDGQMSVDELGAQVKRAAELIRLCREKLRQGRAGSIRSLEGRITPATMKRLSDSY